MRFPLTPFGRREVALYGGGSLAALVALVAGAGLLGVPALGVAAVLPATLFAFTLQFFRDPERDPGAVPAESVLSPADGRVADVVEVDEPEFIGGRAVRIGIFMSPFNCHVNRFPVSGRVAKVLHRAGKFLAAYDPRAIAENEHSVTGIVARFGEAEARVLVRQVSGVAARRIVNPLALGAEAVRGARFGMIKFGSRCELFLPKDAPFEVRVRVGDTVRAGLTVLATFAGAARRPDAEADRAVGAAR